MLDRLRMIRRGNRVFYLGLSPHPEPSLVLYDERAQPTAGASNYVTLFYTSGKQTKYVSKDLFLSSVGDAAAISVPALEQAVDSYCRAAALNLEQEEADAKRRTERVRADTRRFADLKKSLRPWTYDDLLNTFEWHDRREAILRRDGGRCVQCVAADVSDISRVPVHVHHNYYVWGALPWDYPDDALVTLCADCHEHVHLTQEIPVYSDPSEGVPPTTTIKCRRCLGEGYSLADLERPDGTCQQCGGLGVERPAPEINPRHS